MKCLSIRQPWASLIIHGHKPVENRSWQTEHRGALLIHAGKQFDDAGMDSLHATKRIAAIDCVAMYRMPRGAIIGQVNLVDIVRDSDSQWAEPSMWHWILENPQAFTEPIPWRGRQRLWEVDAAELEAARKELSI